MARIRDYFPSRGPHRDYVTIGAKTYPGWVYSWLLLFRIIRK